MENRALWQLMRDAWIKIEPRYISAIDPLVSKSGLGKREWGLLLAALTLEPEDTSPGLLMVRGPYTAAEQYQGWLSNATRRGYLELTVEGQFRLTQLGRDSVVEFIRLARMAMNDVDPLMPEESQRLAVHLDKLISTCLKTPAPPDTWSIGLSYKLIPGREPPLPYIEQAISCLAAYRDDAHLASWQSSELSATALEALTSIWRDQITTLDDLAEKLKSRGHSRQIYANALADLREKAYITGVNSALKLTPGGREFCQEVESTTEQYFFTPWVCLDRTERDEMARILTSLKVGLS